MTNLPDNRRKEFFYLIKYRWKSILLIGGLLFLFSIPLLGSILLKDLKAISIVTTSDGEDVSSLLINDLFYSVFIVPSFVILFIGLSGVYRVVRNYIWAEGVIFKSDFLIGIKQNWFPFALDGFIFSVLFYGLYIATVYINIPYLKYLPIAVCFILIYPVILIHTNLTVVYKNNYFKQMKNALLIYIRRAYIYLPLFILLITIPFVFFIFYIPLIVKYIILILFVNLFLPFFILLFNTYSISVFDYYINKENHQEIYKKGLFLD